MTKKLLSHFIRTCTLGLLAALLGCSGNENGNDFAIAEFLLTKDGSVVLRETFDAKPALLTDSAAPTQATYLPIGRLAAPLNHRQSLSYDNAVSVPVAPPPNTGPNAKRSTRVVQSNGAILQTDTSAANAKAGLKPGMTFELTATFDMLVRGKSKGFYIGLTDAQPASGSRPAVAAKDSIVLGHTMFDRGLTGVSMVYFSSTDHTKSAPGTVTNTTFALMAPDGEQIKLRLRKADANINRITASYALIKQGVVGPYVDLPQTVIGAPYMPIFRDNAYTRPLYGATWPKRVEDPPFTLAYLKTRLFDKPAPQTPYKEAVMEALAHTHPGAREELIAFPTRSVNAKVLVTDEVGKKPAFVALLLPGGAGAHRLAATPDGISMVNEERLQNRLRALLLQRGVASVLVDTPDDNPEMRLFFREGPEHLADLQAALAQARKRFPGAPVVLIGQSAGAWSAAFLAKAAREQIAATILLGGALANTELMNTYDSNKHIRAGLDDFDWGQLKTPLLLVHHKKDDCWASPYSAALELSQRKRLELLTIDSPRDVSTGSCGYYGPHNFAGHEARVADTIVQWVRRQKGGTR